MSAAAADLPRTVFGRPFQNPLLLAAGTAGFGRELDGVMELDRLGGLVVSFEVGGTPLECFYHHVFPHEHHIVGLVDELGLGAKLDWRPSTDADRLMPEDLAVTILINSASDRRRSRASRITEPHLTSPCWPTWGLRIGPPTCVARSEAYGCNLPREAYVAGVVVAAASRIGTASM